METVKNRIVIKNKASNLATEINKLCESLENRIGKFQKKQD